MAAILIEKNRPSSRRLPSAWWTNPDSFLHDELAGHIAYFRDNHPDIPLAAAGYPLNGGLTSAGLANWTNSFHAGFTGLIPGYTGTVFATVAGHDGVPLTLATSTFVNAPVPLPPTSMLLCSALLGLSGADRRYRRLCGSIGRLS